MSRPPFYATAFTALSLLALSQTAAGADLSALRKLAADQLRAAAQNAAKAPVAPGGQPPARDPAPAAMQSAPVQSTAAAPGRARPGRALPDALATLPPPRPLDPVVATLNEMPGKQRYSEEVTHKPLGAAMAAADARQLMDSIGRVRAVLAAMPMIAQPRGFDYGFWSVVNGLQENKAWPGSGSLTLKIFEFNPYAYQKSGKVESSEEGMPLQVEINNFNRLVPNTTLSNLGDEGGRFFQEPQATATLGGHLIYNDSTIVLTRRSQPLFLPVSQERYLRAALAEAREHEKKVGQPDPFIPKLEAELASLSPEERAAPALNGYGKTRPSGLLAGEGKDVRAVVTFNPAFFEGARRGGIHLITLSAINRIWLVHPKFARLMREFDFAGVEALLE